MTTMGGKRYRGRQALGYIRDPHRCTEETLRADASAFGIALDAVVVDDGPDALVPLVRRRGGHRILQAVARGTRTIVVPRIDDLGVDPFDLSSLFQQWLAVGMRVFITKFGDDVVDLFSARGADVLRVVTELGEGQRAAIVKKLRRRYPLRTLPLFDEAKLIDSVREQVLCGTPRSIAAAKATTRMSTALARCRRTLSRPMPSRATPQGDDDGEPIGCEREHDDVAREVLVLERNDLTGAVALYTKLTKEGRWTPSTAKVVAMLFDDPEKFIKHTRGRLGKRPRPPKKSK